mgnify:CR=1 FL=1
MKSITDNLILKYKKHVCKPYIVTAQGHNSDT